MIFQQIELGGKYIVRSATPTLPIFSFENKLNTTNTIEQKNAQPVYFLLLQSQFNSYYYEIEIASVNDYPTLIYFRIINNYVVNQIELVQNSAAATLYGFASIK